MLIRRVAYGTMWACLGMGWYFRDEQNHGAMLAFFYCGMIIAAVGFIDTLRRATKGQPAMSLSVSTRVLGFVIPAVELYELYNPNVGLAHVALIAGCVLVLVTSVQAPKSRPLGGR